MNKIVSEAKLQTITLFLAFARTLSLSPFFSSALPRTHTHTHIYTYLLCLWHHWQSHRSFIYLPNAFAFCMAILRSAHTMLNVDINTPPHTPIYQMKSISSSKAAVATAASMTTTTMAAVATTKTKCVHTVLLWMGLQS